ncbi:MAG: carbohydrate ABC transporter permease [Haloechinothrix sp.]
MRRHRMLSTVARALTALVVLGVATFPIYWMLVTSTMPSSDLFTTRPRLLPDPSGIAIYLQAIRSSTVLRWIGNSALVAAGTSTLSVVVAMFAAYALSRYRFRGRSPFGFALFVTQMMPEALLVVPLYGLFLTLGLLNHLYGLVLVNAAFTMPILVWILKAAIDRVPDEIEEAARIEGCSILGVQMTIVWPLVAPSIAASAVIAFFHGWNEYLFATTFIEDSARWPASVGLASFVGELTTPLDQVMAVALVYATPAIVFFLLAQRWVVSGLAGGAVKE